MKLTKIYQAIKYLHNTHAMKLDLKIWPKKLNPRTANPTIYVYVIFMCYVLVKQLIAMWMFERSELTNVSKIR